MVRLAVGGFRGTYKLRGCAWGMAEGAGWEVDAGVIGEVRRGMLDTVREAVRFGGKGGGKGRRRRRRRRMPISRDTGRCEAEMLEMMTTTHKASKKNHV